MSGRVLIVDDDRNIRRMLRAILEQDAYDVEDAADGAGAVAATTTFAPEVVLLDLVMEPGPDGLATLQQLTAHHPDVVVIMMSGKATLADAVRATQLGAFQFLAKPLATESVVVTVRAALDLARTRAENRAYRAATKDPSALVGMSRAIETVRELIAQVAPTPARVLITGESGTGKELVARSIHEQSDRAERPLIAVNCAAIPQTLIESELFGHERGAFTGAHQRRQGKFELANGGTLFLDEIGDLSLDAQAKLLRVLETGRVERLGSERSLPVDVRVIAATNRVLEMAAAAGEFREDLFYRLNVFPIAVPPLRDRREDVPILVEHFAAEASLRCGRPKPRFEPQALTLMRKHGWRGNVRELANIVERLTIIAGDEPVTAHEVQQMLGSVPTGPARGRGFVGRPDGSARAPWGGLSEALAQYETELIRSAIDLASGNIAEAARLLETDRPNLYRRMRKLGLDPKDTSVSK